jgi:hypothetical protein
LCGAKRRRHVGDAVYGRFGDRVETRGLELF